MNQRNYGVGGLRLALALFGLLVVALAIMIGGGHLLALFDGRELIVPLLLPPTFFAVFLTLNHCGQKRRP